MTSFQMGMYEKVELIADPDGEELTIIIYDWWENDEDFDEEANFQISRTDARTLGQLLLRFADTGNTLPPGAIP